MTVMLLMVVAVVAMELVHFAYDLRLSELGKMLRLLVCGSALAD